VRGVNGRNGEGLDWMSYEEKEEMLGIFDASPKE
jgi:hypothetical protein